MATTRRLQASGALLATLLALATLALPSHGSAPAVQISICPSVPIPLSLSLSETGKIAGTEHRPNILRADWQPTTTEVTTPTLELHKWADRAPVHAGEQLTYTIALTNTGGVTLTATITDHLPAAVAPSGTITWAPEPLAPGAAWTATLPVTVDMSYLGTLTNVVQVTTLEGVSGTYTTTTEVMIAPRLEVTKQAVPDPVVAGWRLAYTIIVTNTGNVDLNATVFDTLPTQVSPSGMRVWELVLAPRGVWSETFQVTVRAGYVGRLVNVVYVETSEGAEGSCSAIGDSIRGHRVYLPLTARVR